MAYQYSQITLDQGVFNMGALLGTAGQPALYKSISEKAGIASSYFGSDMDPLKTDFVNFRQTVVTPILVTNQQFRQAQLSVTRPDIFRPINTIEALKEGPSPCMWVPILQHPPLYRMLKEGLIDGYGYDPDTIPDDDPYGRLINNGLVDFTKDSPNIDPEDPTVLVGVSEFKSWDPVVSYEDLDALEVTRKFIDSFLEDPETSHLDPTLPGEMHG